MLVISPSGLGSYKPVDPAGKFHLQKTAVVCKGKTEDNIGKQYVSTTTGVALQ